MDLPEIDAAMGELNIESRRTIEAQNLTVSILIPAHNEEETIAQVVSDAYMGLEHLKCQGDVTVSASGCTDSTASRAKNAGATVVQADVGKGAAINAGIASVQGDVICLIDGDFQYFGDTPLSAELLRPILNGVADATISDLYWRPLYPNMWQWAFFAPAAGRLFPEMLPKVGATPWSGQRAALRQLWPGDLLTDYRVDLELLLHWNKHAKRLRPVIADDWTNPQRPKPELLLRDAELLFSHAVQDSRALSTQRKGFLKWVSDVYDSMAEYQNGVHDPREFEQHLLRKSIEGLDHALA